MMSDQNKKMDPSFVNIWRIAYPLMLSSLSSFLLVFSDRLILSRYSIDAMNAAASTGMIFWCFQYGTLAIASIAEVFVGQFNGAKEYEKIGSAVWQMIWFSIFSIVIFWPVAFLGPNWFIAEKISLFGTPYFKIIMLFGPCFPLVGALSAFFIGRGKTRAVTLTIILANILNIILDVILIFGIKNIIPPLGVKGAALGTGLSQLSQLMILAFLFLKQEHLLYFRTNDFHFDLKLFLKCLKIGWPNSISRIVGFSAWAILFQMLASIEGDFITTFVVCHGIFTLFCFATNGMNKAIVTMGANAIGGMKYDHVSKLIKSSLLLQAILSFIVFIPMIAIPGPLIKSFLSTKSFSLELYLLIKNALIWLWFFYFVDGIYLIFQGILTAAGDTKFTMILDMVSVWFLAIIPIYLFVIHFNFSPSLTWKIMTISFVITAFILFIRYKIGAWKQIQLIKDSAMESTKLN